MAQGLPLMDQVRQWSGQDVIDWLNRMNLSECVEVFTQREIDGHALLNFSEEQLILLLTDLKLKHRLQLTKYINQCKEKDLTFKSAKKKILSIAQPKTPPPVPQVDYRWTDDDSEKSWGSDFDEDSDCEEDNQNSYDNRNNTESQFDELVSEENKNKVVNDIDLPEQPQIPWRKIEKMKTPELNESSETNNTRLKPPVAAKPAIKPKPVIEAINSNKIFQINSTGLPRPPSGLPTKFPRVVRPSEQPPPPPVKNQLPELQDEIDHSPFEEYEVPLSCSSSIISDTVSVSSHASNNAYSSSTASQSYGDVSADESGSSSSSYGSEQPALPPRLSPQTHTAPPLPRKPIKTPEFVRTCEKPVLLPTRRSEENSKSKEGQLKAITGVLKNKFSTLLHVDKSSKGDSSSSHSGSRSSTPEHAVSLSNLCQEQTQQSTLNRTHSQEPLGNRETGVGISRVHRSSLDDGVSMQNRPLPPLPTQHERRPSAPSVLLEPEEQLFDYPWFHSVERNAAESMLLELQQTGSYLVRQSRRAGETNPYTLSVLFEGKVFHLNIRQRSDHSFALGKEKTNEKAFESVEELIETHQTEPILLTSKGLSAGKIILLTTPKKR